MKKYIKILWIILLIGLDQLVKAVIASNYEVGEGFPVIKDILEINYVQNTGAAWGMMADSTVFFAIFAFIVTIILLYVLFKIPADKSYNYLKITMVFLISGAVGNLIDRICRKFVVDFIYFKIIDFPVFNIADIYITVSGIALVILVLFYYKEEQLEFLSLKKQKSNN
ncbi:MAG: signal peptidase II [Lachnospiraceae bacterium]|nr:signal peptidase II [Lachnospiraceae bacterium]